MRYGVDKDVATVGGDSSVTVEQAQESSVSQGDQVHQHPTRVPAGGGVVTVTIDINGNYGIGSVVEKLPPDFTYVPGSVTPSDITDITVDLDENTVTFPLVGESSFSYEVNTSISSGEHLFPSGSQLSYGVDKDVATVGGDSSVTVGTRPTHPLHPLHAVHPLRFRSQIGRPYSPATRSRGPSTRIRHPAQMSAPGLRPVTPTGTG